MEKMTKRNVYEALINYANGGAMAYAGDEGDVVVSAEALAAFAENEISLLDKSISVQVCGLYIRVLIDHLKLFSRYF